MDDLIRRSDAIRVASGYCHWTNIPKELAKLPSVNPIPCEDAISRQAVLDLAFDMAEIDGEHFDKPFMVVEADDIKVLPSVTQKTGHWIYDKNGLYKCSECENRDFGDDINFCSNCGAKMLKGGE